MKKLAGSCFYQLRAVRRSLTTDTATTLVHALISSCVDYCNSVLNGMCEVYLRPLQLVLNSAARLITGKRKFDCIITKSEGVGLIVRAISLQDFQPM